MTTYIAFQPSPLVPFQFQAQLDGVTYNIVIRWNVTRQGWTYSIYDANNVRILTSPLVGSPAGLSISAASWANGLVTMTTSTPHGLKIGQAVNLTISGMVAAAYNGAVSVMVTSRTTFTYPLAFPPGIASVLGTANYDISLTKGYFASTLVFRDPTQTFEVSP